MPQTEEISKAIDEQDGHKLYWSLVRWYFEALKKLKPKNRIKALGYGIGSIAKNLGLTIDSQDEKMAFRLKGCSICGYNIPEAIEIHHIDKNRENNSIYNLLPLCRNCHKLVHRGMITITPMSVDTTSKEVNISYQLNK